MVRKPLKPLKIKCADADCAQGLHCFRKSRNSTFAPGTCRECGEELVDWSRLHRNDHKDMDYTFSMLKREYVRHHFWHVELTLHAVNYARRKGRVGLREAAERIVRKKIGAALPAFDGRQTPREGSGNPIHYAQHATATCCRKCLEYWHGVPMGRELSVSEIAYFVGLIMRYENERLPNITELGEKVPPISKAKRR